MVPHCMMVPHCVWYGARLQLPSSSPTKRRPLSAGAAAWLPRAAPACSHGRSTQRLTGGRRWGDAVAVAQSCVLPTPVEPAAVVPGADGDDEQQGLERLMQRLGLGPNWRSLLLSSLRRAAVQAEPNSLASRPALPATSNNTNSQRRATVTAAPAARRPPTAGTPCRAASVAAKTRQAPAREAPAPRAQQARQAPPASPPYPAGSQAGSGSRGTCPPPPADTMAHVVRRGRQLIKAAGTGAPLAMAAAGPSAGPAPSHASRVSRAPPATHTPSAYSDDFESDAEPVSTA